MGIGARLKEIIDDRGTNVNQIAKQTNISPMTIYSIIKRDNTKVDIEILLKICKALNVSIEDIYQPNFKSDSNGNISKSIQSVYENNIEILPNSNIHMIPVFETVSAGFGAYANDCIIDYMPLYIANISDVPDMMCIKVTGDSMYPKIEDGDIIVVRRQPCVDNGQVAVVLIDGEEGVVKKINAGKNFIELISINPMYPPRLFEDEEVERIRIVGLVKQIIKNI